MLAAGDAAGWDESLQALVVRLWRLLRLVGASSGQCFVERNLRQDWHWRVVVDDRRKFAAPALRLLKEAATEGRPVWGELDALIASGRGEEWPRWCVVPAQRLFQPLADVYDPMGEGLHGPAKSAVWNWSEILATAAAWRLTKGVYAFDHDLFEELWATPVTGRIPTGLLHHLPEWCVFIPIPERDTAFGRVTGVFARLDQHEDRGDLLALLVTVAGPNESIGVRPFYVFLKSGDIAEGIKAFTDRWTDEHGQAFTPELVRERANLPAFLGSIVSLVLWLCSEEPEIDGVGRPRNPMPTKTKKGMRVFAAEGPRTWDVGVRIGATLRSARSGESSGDAPAGSGRAVRPHVRRAHWHTYLTGPRDGERTPVLRWLHPILVGAKDTEELPAVVRSVD